MNYRVYAIQFVALCASGLLYSGLAAAENNFPASPKSAGFEIAAIAGAGASGFAVQPAQPPSGLMLAKAGKSAGQRACEAKCKKDYRRCYSQGNKPGTPDVNGGEPCSEQKTTCMRACAT